MNDKTGCIILSVAVMIMATVVSIGLHNPSYLNLLWLLLIVN